MNKQEYYAKMRELFIKHFGQDFREHRRKIRQRLRAGEASEINALYQYATYDLRLFGGAASYAHFCYDFRYNLWDYDRFYKLWKHL